jgi:hypothetical protein
LIEKLCDVPGRPWTEYGNPPKPLTQNKLAKLLKPLAVSPQLLRLPDSDDPVRGYQRSQFDEAFERYLSSEGGDPNRYNVTNPENAGTSALFRGVTGGDNVTVQKSQKPNDDGVCNGVTVQKGGMALRTPLASLSTPLGASPIGTPTATIPAARRLTSRASSMTS